MHKDHTVLIIFLPLVVISFSTNHLVIKNFSLFFNNCRQQKQEAWWTIIFFDGVRSSKNDYTTDERI